MVKETFIIRAEWWDAIELLNDEEKANILNNLFGFHMGNCEKLGFCSKNVELVWKLLLPNLKFNQEKYDKRRETSAINGFKGGRPTEKQKPKKPTLKPNKPIETLSVFVTDTVSDTDTVTETVIETEGVIAESKKNDTPHFLENSNLFRKPNIPTFEEVHYYFTQNGGTEQMARSFFDRNDGMGWFYKGSPIMNFRTMAHGFIKAWKDIESKNAKPEQTKPKTATDEEIQNLINEYK